MNKKSYLKVFCTFFVVAMCLFITSDAMAQAYGNYNYRKKLILNTTSYISGSSNLNNFPVLLEIVDSDLIKSGLSSDKLKSQTANDIAFTDATVMQSSATEYSYQLESYDASTGTLKVWVKIPTLLKSTNNSIYIYFGSDNPPAHPVASATWTSDYKAIFHFNESAYSVTTGAVKDGTGVNNATITSSANNLNQDGKIGSAYSFNGSNQKITTANTFNITGNFTVSAWVKPNVVNRDQKILTNQAVYSHGFKLGVGDNAKLTAESNNNSNFSTAFEQGGNTLSAGNWHYVQATYENNSLKSYVNGALDRSTYAIAPAAASVLNIGVGEGGNVFWFDGLIDEVRVSNEVKSADWIATEYNNQRYPGSTGTGLNGGLPFINDYGDLETTNTAPSAISDADATINSIPENSANGTAVGITVLATDEQGTALSYSLTDDAGGRFTINASSGVVSVANSALLNYELATTHTITVQAFDGGLTSSQTFSIAVTNVVEALGALMDNNASANTISENAANNTSVGITAYAEHEDGVTVTYSLTDNAGGRFKIDANSGVIKVLNSTLLNYELNSSHIVTVQATDGLTTTSEAFSIAVSDFYDNTYGAYAFQKPVTLNNNLLGISSDLTNFPVLLKIQDNNLILGNSCAGVISSPAAPNIAFIDPSSPTTELHYDIESFDSATGTLLVWVKIPTLTAAVNNTIYLYFGATTAVVTHDAAFYKATWSNVTSSAASYKGVWHFNENPASSLISDATIAGNSLQKGGTVTQNSSSIIGNGATLFNGGLFKAGITGLPNTNTTQTISFWAYYTSTPNTTGNMVSIQNRPDNSAIQIGPRDSKIAVWGWQGGNTPLITNSGYPSSNNWHHYAYSWDGSTNKLYVDGVLITTTSNAHQTGNPYAISFGSYLDYTETPAGEYFNGSIDEGQLIDVALSPDWIKASYINQLNPLAYTTAGTLQTIAANVVNTPGALVFTWTGSADTNILNADNWNNLTTGINNQLPHYTEGTATVIIPGGLTNYPSLTSDFSIYGLAVASGASISLNGHTLSVKCNFVNNGQLLYNNNSLSALAFNGSLATQSYAGNAATAQVGKLEVNNTASGTVNITGGGIDVYNLLTVTKGTLNANNLLTLKASETAVSSVGPLLNGAAVTGYVNIETYFTGGTATHRGTKAISAPVNESLSSLKTFQQLKSYMILTGFGGTSNGFDQGGTSNPNSTSIFRYNELANLTQSQFTPVNNITESLLPGVGALIFYRGSRANYSSETAAVSNKVNAPYAVPESMVIKYNGTINQGDVTVNLSYTNHDGEGSYNGYNLVGNPYPAVIDWDLVTKNNVNNELIFFKPGGGYATYSGGIVVPETANLRYIQPGQAFYLKANSANPSVIFTENCKSTANSPARLLNKSATEKLALASTFSQSAKLAAAPVKLLRIKLQDAANTEEAVAVFKNGKHAEALSEDATFFGGSTVGLSTLSSDKVKLTVNYMPELSKVDTLKLSVTALNSGKVTLNFTDLSAIEGYQAILKDNYLNKMIDVNTVSAYPFTIDKSIAATYGDQRFSIIFDPITTLPVNITAFTAKKASTGAQLRWTTLSETNSSTFEIERSENGINFSAIGSLKAKGNSAVKSDYIFMDANPVKGDNYYRLKLLDQDGKFTNSAPINLNFLLEDNLKIVVYPNPSTQFINMDLQRSGAVNARIISPSGEELKSLNFNKDETLRINVSDLIYGIYVIELKEISTNKVIGKGKFVKE